MALRLDTAVIRGEIDNTTRGNVRGKLWLVGREEPVILDLRGNAWRDVAGTRLTFTNPNPVAQPAADSLQPKQTGYVGDVTASRKVKDHETATFDIPEDEPAAEWHNALYFEWFSNENGRVFVESTGFELSISEWIWEMDEADEDAQKMTNLHTMRGWLAGIIQRPEPKEGDDEEEDFDDSEESWEESLKQSDRLSDAHLEALEKYGMYGLDDDRVFFVMGWDHMLDRGERRPAADADDADEDDGEAWKQADGQTAPKAIDEEDFERWLEEEEKREQHPLQKRAHDLVLRLMTDIDEEREENSQTSDGSTALDRFIRNSMNISGKLAGALGFGEMSGSRDRGYTLAILRRCLNWANEALAALNELSESPAWQTRLDLLGEFRAELFAIRDGITDLRKELREN